MIDMMHAFWQSLLAGFPQAYATGLIMNATIMGLAFFIFWKWLAKRLATWKVQFGKTIASAQIKRELRNALFATASGAFTSCIVLFMVSIGATRIYTNVSEHALWVALIGFPLMLFFNDMWFYWMHRLMHHPRIYRYIHAEHHRSINVNPLTSYSFHFAEPLLLTLWIVPFVMIVPLYAPVVGLVQFYGIYDNVKSHLGYEIYPRWLNRSPLRWLSTSTYHNLHHTKYHGNYGLHFRFWDRLMGTELERYEADFEEIVTRRAKPKEVTLTIP
jgi:Delta7-sterol 5-desaturase